MRKILDVLMKDAPPSQPKKIKFIERPTCQGCLDYIDKPGLCADCRQAIERGYQISQLAGRRANGAERDRGSLWHARLPSSRGWQWAALCGYEPGRRSVGWSIWRPEDRKVTCKRCLKKIEKLGE